jgi:hypothetical protein
MIGGEEPHEEKTESNQKQNEVNSVKIRRREEEEE